MGIRDDPVAARSPWQNGHAERLIGSIRRECLDHLVVSGEAHLRQVLKTYAAYYNEVRTHRWTKTRRSFDAHRGWAASSRCRSSVGSTINTFGFEL
jgi:transposase InsO family protein